MLIGTGPEPVAERQRILTGMEHHPGHECLAGRSPQAAEATEVLSSHSGARLHLDAGDSPVGCLQHGIDLRPVTCAEVVQGGSLGGPAELTPELHGHEGFQHGAGVLARAAQASGRGAEKVGGQAAVDDKHLGRVYDSRRSAR